MLALALVRINVHLFYSTWPGIYFHDDGTVCLSRVGSFGRIILLVGVLGPAATQLYFEVSFMENDTGRTSSVPSVAMRPLYWHPMPTCLLLTGR